MYKSPKISEILFQSRFSQNAVSACHVAVSLISHKIINQITSNFQCYLICYTATFCRKISEVGRNSLFLIIFSNFIIIQNKRKTIKMQKKCNFLLTKCLLILLAVIPASPGYPFPPLPLFPLCSPPVII